MNAIALRLSAMSLVLEGSGMPEIVEALQIAEREILRLDESLNNRPTPKVHGPQQVGAGAGTGKLRSQYLPPEHATGCEALIARSEGLEQWWVACDCGAVERENVMDAHHGNVVALQLVAEEVRP
jgi:hypothetical protein